MQRFQRNEEFLIDCDIESLLHSSYPVEPDCLKNSVISCTLEDQKYKSFANNLKKIEKFFPEHVIGCKTICNETKLVVATSRNSLTVYSIPDFSVESTSQCDYYAASICSLILGNSLENLIIIFGSVEGDLIEWNTNNNTTPTRRKGHCGMVFAITSDSSNLFSISDDRTIRMWEKNGGEEPICTVFGHTARPFAIHVDEENRRIYTGGIEQTLFIWDYSEDRSIKLIRKIFLTIGVIRKITQSDPTTLNVGSHDGNLVQIDVSPREPLEEIAENVVNFSFLDDVLVTIDENNTLTVYNNLDMEEILACCENVKNMSPSGSGEIVAWNGKKLYFVEKNNVTVMEMNEVVISAITTDRYIMVKTLDGWTTLLDTRNLAEMMKTRFKLPKISMIPASFVVIQNCLVLATTHGELFHCSLNTTDEFISIERSLERKLEKELFRGKEITCIKAIDDNYFMTLSKCGNWTTFEIDGSKKGVKVANTRSFPTSARMGWPCRFLETLSGETYIVGFYGTSFVVWDASNGIPVYEIYCGGGHRIWEISMCSDSSSAVNFDFLRNGSLYRQRIPLDSIRHVVHSAHSSPIVCCSASSNLVASVSLDGILSITSNHEPDTCDYVLEFTMFAGENLLCNDIWQNERNVFVVTGGGKSKMSIWRFETNSLRRSKTFWLRDISRPNEGRIVSTKIVQINGQIVFVASFSSGCIEIFKIENDEIVSLNSVEIDDELGIGSKMCVSNESILHVGTSGSYLLTYEIGIEMTRLISKRKLNDRSGVTAIFCLDNSGVIVGCDSGGVYRLKQNTDEECIHRHLSTIVGIVVSSHIVHSISLDTAVVTTNLSEKSTNRRYTVLGMPGTMALARNSIIIAGDGIEAIRL